MLKGGDFARKTVELPRRLKRFISVCTDCLMIPLALWTAISLKTGHPETSFSDWPAFAAVIAVSIPIFVRAGLYRAVIRFLGHKAIFAVALSVAMSAVILGIVGMLFQIPVLTWSVVAIYSVVALLYVAGTRFVVRYYLLRRYLMPTVARVAIYGAGEAGANLSNLLLTTRAFDPVIFIDDNKGLRGRFVNGIKVQLPDHLPSLVKTHEIDRILLAVPSLSRRRRREILTQLEPLGVHVQSVPDIEQLVTGSANLADLREVDVADLLGRDAVPPKDGLFDACIRDRVVMVTGAGGSIGSRAIAGRLIIGLKLPASAGPVRNVRNRALQHRKGVARAGRKARVTDRVDRSHWKFAGSISLARYFRGVSGTDGISRGCLQTRAHRRTECRGRRQQQRDCNLACG